MTRNPFSAGKWVRGPQFFGREDLINMIIDDAEPCDWVIGKRRVGKTSLLREIELRLNKSHSDKFPIYWDIQGSYDSEGLYDSLYDAIEDAQDLNEERWEDLEFDLPDEGTCHQLLKRLSRTLMKNNMKLFILIDEGEELINVGKQDPVLLSKLRRIFQSNQNVHTVIASTPRLEQLYKTMDTETSPFLHGFNVSYLGNLNHEDSCKLAAQGFDDPAIQEKMFELTDGNPFEIQLLGKHLYEHDQLDDVLLQLEANPMLNQTIEVNNDLLSPDEMVLLKKYQSGQQSLDNKDNKGSVAKLLHMGYLKHIDDNTLSVGSWFQAKALGAQPVVLQPVPNKETDENTDENAAADIPLSAENPIETAKQVLGIYQLFLELAQERKQLTTENTILLYSPAQGRVILPPGASFQPDAQVLDPWQIAIEAMVTYLSRFLNPQDNWSLFRLLQMKEKGVHHYEEQEFLDLLMLITEEASLG